MKLNSKAKKIFAGALAAVMIAGMTACAGQEADTAAASYLTKEDITVNETIENSEDGGHAIETSGEEAEYSNIGVTKTGEAAGWGNEGSNGGHVNLNASGQVIDGNIIVDDVSTLNMYLKDKSVFTGAINTDGQKGDVYVEIEDGSSWTLTADSYVSGLTVGEGSAIDLNGHKLYVDGKEYTEGSASEGTAFDITAAASSGSGSGTDAPDGAMGGNAPDGNLPAKPDGEAGGQGGPGGNPPSGDPPAKPGSNN